MYIDEEILRNLKSNSREEKRKRSHLLMHENKEDKIQSLLFGLQPGTKITPHKHKSGTETICCLSGELAVIFFNEEGVPKEFYKLDHKNCMLKFDPTIWHTYICLQKDTIGWEIKEGPYIEINIQPAPWCPEENSPEFTSYQKSLKNYMEVKI